MSVQNISPAGSTVAVAGTTTASSVYVTSLQPVNKWHIVNSGTTPCQVRMNSNLSTTVTAVFPTGGSPSLGAVVNGGDDQVIILPSALNGTITGAPFTPFTSNLQCSVIFGAGSTGGNVFITPVV